jgi:ribosome-binding protein aMBF1 (putative translation factor)
MATTSKDRVRERTGHPTRAEVNRLRLQVARLRAEVRALKAGRTAQGRKSRPPVNAAAPALPPPGEDGNYPAEETLRALVAQQIIRRRRQAGWTQAELAVRAGVRQETVSRLETGKHAPNVTTVDKIERVLREAGV